MLSSLLRDHFAPHPPLRFDGYYTRTQTEDGATIAVIFCWMKGAKKRGNLILVLYDTPHDRRGGLASFKYEFYPEHFDVTTGEFVRGRPQSFTITAPGLGSMKVTPETIEYDVSVPDKSLRLHLLLTNHKPWSNAHPLEGPMGSVLHISHFLPLNWHVRSTQSIATFQVAHGDATIRGTGHAHPEKNWGSSFPRGWIWAQSFSADGKHTLCLAGGEALPGIQAYLVGYRSPVCPDWDFRPPWAFGLGSFAPFMQVRRDPVKGEVEITLSTWSRKLHVLITAPPDTFVGVPGPLKDGHQPNYCHESFQAKVTVQASCRRWPGAKWELVEDAVLGQTADGTNCGALEFGGSYGHGKHA
ncbi:hypothetical protein PYCCODRAFT_359480 [Trametes coccinea BRFM310]|uniref:Tocopherol cyclase n=1 Tax=Trametes coccinea (strain BRFM310) TaxID=1353009 RepID=A0A1Y2J6L0_TRAC3|nr:hypothetical protein PYCCODRAFT_359480 [Trametes coccinea BRFM310]